MLSSKKNLSDNGEPIVILGMVMFSAIFEILLNGELFADMVARRRRPRLQQQKERGAEYPRRPIGKVYLLLLLRTYAFNRQSKTMH
jgi:hypothetical protein